MQASLCSRLIAAFFIELRSSLLSLGIADASIALLSLNRSLLHSSFFILHSSFLIPSVFVGFQVVDIEDAQFEGSDDQSGGIDANTQVS